MSINKPLFDEIYEECLQIISNSQDKNIISKRTKLDVSYNKLCELEDHEHQEFYSVVHELRLYSYLKQIGISVSAANDNKAGPDFISDIGYIECVCLTKGEKGTPQRKCLDDRLRGSMNRYVAALPRLTSVLLDKQKKFSDYLSRNLIDENKPRIIAVNTSIFSNEFHSDSNLDLALKVLYGIGCQTMCFDIKTNSFVDEKGVETHAFEDRGIKPPQNIELQLDYFSGKLFKNVSGVIIVNNSIGEKISKKYFNLLVNPNSNVPINFSLLNKLKYLALQNMENGYVNYQWFNQ